MPVKTKQHLDTYVFIVTKLTSPYGTYLVNIEKDNWYGIDEKYNSI